MAGLLTPPMGEAEVMSDGDAEGLDQASPEEMEIYNEVVSRGMLFIYNPRITMKLVEMMRAENDPKKGLATVAAMVFSRINTAIEQSGRDIPGDVRFHAAAEIFSEIADIASAARLHDFDADKPGAEDAWYDALDQYRLIETQTGQVDQDAAQADMQELSRADQDGSLKQIMDSLRQQQGAA